MRLTVAVTSDFICPWCFIGEQKLATAIAAVARDFAVDIVFRPFELNPDMPDAGVERRVYRTAKFGSWERSQALDANLVAAGREEGLAFNFDRVTRTPSTKRAHRLMWAAGRDGVDQRGLARRLFEAYFTEGLDISDGGVLRAIAAEAGVQAERVAAVLDGDLGRVELDAAIELAYRRGISGVPFFEIGGMGVSGAQPAAVLEQVMRQAVERQAA